MTQPARQQAPPAESPVLEPEPRTLAAAIGRLEAEDATAVPVLPPATRRALLAEAGRLSFRPAKPVVGEGECAVYQDFEITFDVPPDGAFAGAAAAFERLVNRALATTGRAPCPPVVFNDRAVQRYPRGCGGISPHRDHLRYVGLVAILVVAGHGRFSVCADRSGRAARAVPAAPGDALLMRAPGFAGSDRRPFHMLHDVSAERLILGLRHDARA